MSRAEFEAWYATHAFNYERDPIGSRDCGLQWAAWKAATERAAKKCEYYQVPVGNSRAGELAAEWTLDALRECAAAIRGEQ